MKNQKKLLNVFICSISILFLFFFFTSNKVNAQNYMKLCESGISNENTGNLDEAIAKYSSAITLKPATWNAYSYRAKVYYRKGKYDNAIVDISKAIELSPKKLFLYHVRANCYLAKKEYVKAIADYNMVLLKPKNSDPQLFKIYLYRGEAYYKNKQYQEAINDFTQSLKTAAKQNVTLTTAYNYRALCYYEMGRYVEAISDFDVLLNNDAQNTIAIFYQGLCYYKTGETAKAKENALKIIELDPSKEVYFSGDKMLDIYDLEMRRKMVKQSIDDAKKAMNDYKSSTSKTVAAIKLAEAFAKLDKAWFYSSKIEKEDKDLNDTILSRISVVYSLMKEKPELSELARKYMVQANTATENKNYNDALKLFNKAISIAPYYPLAYYNRSLVKELLEKYDDAIIDMKKYIELYPDASNIRSAQDKIYEWEGNVKNNKKYVFSSADGNIFAVSNTEATMNSSAIDIENVVGNKIETENKATQGFFIGYGFSTPRKNYGLVPGVALSSIAMQDTSSWKSAIFDNGKLGASSGWYVEAGIGLDMEQKAKVRFHYNPFVFSLSKNKLDWSSRKDSLFKSGTDSSKSYFKIELAQRYGISYAPIPKLVFAFYYRIGMTLPVTNYKISYQSEPTSEYFKLTSENKAAFIPFSHSLGFSVSYSFFTFSYESYFLKERYMFTAKYHGALPTDTEQEVTFNGKVPMRTNRIGLSIHF